MPGLLEKKYQELVTLGRIDYDPAQLVALQQLQKLQDQLLAHAECKQKLMLRKWRLPPMCRSLYIFGEVGRGKSMLMDLFYQTCPIKQKRRVHFHAFMLEIHNFVHQWHQQHDSDAISALAQHIILTQQLLCLDEFHVTDIADAMLIVRLFGKLIDLGLTVVTTSNYHPNELYRGGLQRELFLPFIKLLQENTDTIYLSGDKDYRCGQQSAVNTRFYFPLNEHASEFAQQHCKQLTNYAPMHAVRLHVLGRQLVLSAAFAKIAMTSFHELCVQPLGSSDYLTIASHFETIILTDIPRLNSDLRNETKRFITLIDALYEYKVRLICTAAVPLNELCVADDVIDFARTHSRLVEMQSARYL
ncbi:MAG: cell division protein ZapE [Methylococcaceae bacterium]|nr:cell division protein ZapE [Methylococcaceae bacterium]